MILDANNKSVEVLLGEAISTAQCQVTASYASTVAGASFTPASNDLVTNGVTAVTAVAAPSTGQRQALEVNVYNADTINHKAIIRLNNGGTTRIIQSKVIAPGETLTYSSVAQQGPTGATGAAAGTLGTPADFSLFFSGSPGASQTLLTWTATRSITLPASLTGSYFTVGVNPTATWTAALTKNGSSIGSVSISTFGVATVTFASAVTFTAGDVFNIAAPATADVTISDIMMAFAATFA